MDSTPTSKRLYCVYQGASAADDSSPRLSGMHNNLSSSSSRDLRLSNKLQEARMRRQFMRSGSISMEKQAQEEKKEIKNFGVWEEASQGNDYMLKPPASKLMQVSTKNGNPGSLTFVSDRVIKMKPRDPQTSNQVYELFSERNEPKEKFNAYNMIQVSSNNGLSRVKKQLSMTGFSTTVIKKPASRTPSYQSSKPKNLNPTKVIASKVPKNISPIQAELDAIELNLKEAMDNLHSIRPETYRIYAIKKNKLLTPLGSRNYEDEISPLQTKKTKPFFANKGQTSRGLIKANSMTTNFESREPIEAVDREGTPQGVGVGDTSRSKPSIINKALDMNSRRGVSNYTKLFIS